MELENGKILSVRYFLNTRLKPNMIEGQNAYPIYMTVVYNRKSLQLKVNWDLIINNSFSPFLDSRNYHTDPSELFVEYFTLEEFEAIMSLYEKFKEVYPNEEIGKEYETEAILLNEYRKIIEISVAEEVRRKGDLFELNKRFRKKLSLYFSSLFYGIGEYLNEEISRIYSNRENFTSSFFYENFEILLRADLLESIEEDLKKDIELYFLIGSLIDSEAYFEDRLVYWAFIENYLNELLLHYNRYFSRTPEKTLPVENFFYRYTLLMPPSQTVDYYCNRVENFISYILKEQV